MRTFRTKRRWALVIGATALSVLVIGTIKVSVPPHLEGQFTAQGQISQCTFKAIGRGGGEFFMSVTLDAPTTPLLRFNGSSSQRDSYEGMCDRKPVVRVTYHAVKRIIGPVRFWIDHVAEV